MVLITKIGMQHELNINGTLQRHLNQLLRARSLFVATDSNQIYSFAIIDRAACAWPFIKSLECLLFSELLLDFCVLLGAESSSWLVLERNFEIASSSDVRATQSIKIIITAIILAKNVSSFCRSLVKRNPTWTLFSRLKPASHFRTGRRIRGRKSRKTSSILHHVTSVRLFALANLSHFVCLWPPLGQLGIEFKFTVAQSGKTNTLNAGNIPLARWKSR